MFGYLSASIRLLLITPLYFCSRSSNRPRKSTPLAQHARDCLAPKSCPDLMVVVDVTSFTFQSASEMNLSVAASLTGEAMTILGRVSGGHGVGTIAISRFRVVDDDALLHDDLRSRWLPLLTDERSLGQLSAIDSDIDSDNVVLLCDMK